MKNKLILMLCCLCTVALASCQLLGDERVAVTKTFLERRVTNESGGAFTLTSFNKINGTEQDLGGMKAYELEFTCAVTAEKDCWKVGSFSAYSSHPTYDQVTNPYEAQQIKKGTRVPFRGKATLVKKDNGWSVEEMSL
jgi:hypothetical protein